MALISLLLAAVLLAVSASDDFNRADGGVGSNWTNQLNTLVVLNNHARGGSEGADNFAYWSFNTFANDQESSATFTLDAVSYVGVTVRASSSGGSRNAYYFLTNGDNFSALAKTVAGTGATLSTSFSHPASGSVVKIRVVGTRITIWDDGVDISTTACSGSPCDDSSLTSGNPGIYANNASGADTTYLDNWLGADVGAGGSAAPCLLLLGVSCDALLMAPWRHHARQ